MKNRPLQLRGGKNYGVLLDVITSIREDTVLLKSSEQVVLEGTDNLNVIRLGPAVSYIIDTRSRFTLKNRTGVDITEAALYLEDKYGGSVKVASHAIVDGDDYTFSFGAFICLSKGDKLSIRVTGDPSAGDGVLLTRTVANLNPSMFIRMSPNEKVTQSSLKFKGLLPGVTACNWILFAFINVSGTDVNVSAIGRTPEGVSFVIEESLVAAGAWGSYRVLNGEGYETQISFDVLPSDGHLYGALIASYPANTLDKAEVQPVLE